MGDLAARKEQTIDFKINEKLLVEDEHLVKRLFLKLKGATLSLIKPESGAAKTFKAMSLCKKANKLLNESACLENLYLIVDYLKEASKLLKSAGNRLFYTCFEDFKVASGFLLKSVKEKAVSLYNSAYEKFNNKNLKEAKEQFESAYSYFNQLSDDYYINASQTMAAKCQKMMDLKLADEYFQIGKKYRNDEEFAKALEYISTARTYYKKSGLNADGITKCENLLGLYQNEKQQFETNCNQQGSASFNIAINHYGKKDYKTALVFFKGAKEKFLKASNVNQVEICSRRIGRCERLIEVEAYFNRGVLEKDKKKYYYAVNDFEYAKKCYKFLNCTEEDFSDKIALCEKYTEYCKGCVNLKTAKKENFFGDYGSATKLFSAAAEHFKKCGEADLEEYCTKMAKETDRKYQLKLRREEEKAEMQEMEEAARLEALENGDDEAAEREWEEKKRKEEEEKKKQEEYAEDLFKEGERCFENGDYERAKDYFTDALNNGYSHFDCYPAIDKCDKALRDNENSNDY